MIVPQYIVNGGKRSSTKTRHENTMASRDAAATRPRQYRLTRNNSKWARYETVMRVCVASGSWSAHAPGLSQGVFVQKVVPRPENGSKLLNPNHRPQLKSSS